MKIFWFVAPPLVAFIIIVLWLGYACASTAEKQQQKQDSEFALLKTCHFDRSERSERSGEICFSIDFSTSASTRTSLEMTKPNPTFSLGE